MLTHQSINPLACTECGDSLPFSGASSIPPCHTLFPAAPLRRPFFHPPSPQLAIYFLVYLLVLLFPDSYTILFWEYVNTCKIKTCETYLVCIGNKEISCTFNMLHNLLYYPRHLFHDFIFFCSNKVFFLNMH